MEVVYQVCAALVVILGFLAGAFFSTGHRDLALWSTCAGILVAIAGLFCFWQAYLWSSDAAANILAPGNGETPPLWPGAEGLPITDDTLLVFLGNRNLAATNFDDLVVLRQRGEPMLTVVRDSGGILISAKFFNRHGTILCEIVDNTFHLNANNCFRMERKPNRLTVFDHEAKVAMDVEYINKRTVRVLGDYYLRNGLHIAIAPELVTFNDTELREITVGDFETAFDFVN